MIVVEHDLAVLDYLTDYINIFYGEPGAYGVVSNLKSSRTGVNEYLDGFLSDENMRIRKEPITFDLRGISEFTPGEKIIDYLEFRKELGDFIFKSKQGAVHENEIIGILGPNATGKTTFMKILAGVIQPDEGKFESSLKIAYKPQYLKPEVGFVKEIIELYDLNQEVFTEMKKKLGIEQLMEKECSKLSGGELQRFSIALTLSREADLYLLDEPSAFLDIEQRLSLSSILRSRIKEKKACFVVDHDVVFIDNVSDKIIVFDGVPGNSGRAGPSLKKRDAMNSFLKIMGVTMRRDKDTHRPRINKLDSVLDREQKEKGEYYYIA